MAAACDLILPLRKPNTSSLAGSKVRGARLLLPLVGLALAFLAALRLAGALTLAFGLRFALGFSIDVRAATSVCSISNMSDVTLMSSIITDSLFVGVTLKENPRANSSAPGCRSLVDHRLSVTHSMSTLFQLIQYFGEVSA